MARSLGVRDLAFASRVPGGGAGSIATVYQAAAAVASSACEIVVVWRAINQGAAYRYGQPQTGGAFQPGSGTSSLLWCMPFGAQAPASWAALAIQRYMHEFGVTNLDFGRVAVLQRKHAATNPAAVVLRASRSRSRTTRQSRWIVEPVLRLLDCCLESDGAVAAVITSPSAREISAQSPVRVVAARRSIPSATASVISNYYHDDLACIPRRAGSAQRLLRAVGLEPGRHRGCMLYENFTPERVPNSSKRSASAGMARRRTSSPTASSTSTAASRPTPTAGSSARPTSTG